MYRVKLRFRKLRGNSYRFCASSSSSSLPLVDYPIPLDLNPTATTTTTTTTTKSRNLARSSYCQVKFSSEGGGNLYPCVKSAMASLDGDIARRLTFTECVKSYSFSHSVESFAMLIGIYSSANMYPEAYGCLIQVLAESSMVYDALELFLDAKEKEIKLGVPLCNFVLKCFVDRNAIDIARSLFSMSPSPNVYTFTIMMDLYTKKDTLDMDEAEKIFLEMERSGVSPNEVTYGAYLRGLCFAGEVERAWKLLSDLQEIDSGQLCNNYCYNAVMLSFCRRGDMDKSLMVLTRMKDCGLSPDVNSYSILIDGFCKKGDDNTAYKLFDEMVRCGIMSTVVIYTSLVHCSCVAGDVEKAEKTFREFGSKGHGDDDLIIYSILMDAYFKRGDVDSASRLWEEMEQNGFTPDIFCYTRIIYGCCMNQRLEQAIICFRLMLEDGPKPNIFIYSIIIDALYKDKSMAWEVVGTMIKRGIVFDVVLYSILIEVSIKMSSIEEACKLFKRMSMEGIMPNVFTYTSLINGLCAVDGSLPEVLRLFKEMKQNGLSPDKMVYSSIICGLCRWGYMITAMKFFDKMGEDNILPDEVVYNSIITGWCMCKDMNKAMRYFNRMVQSGLFPDCHTYNCLINAYSKLLAISVAETLLAKMICMGLTPYAITYRALIHGYQNIGDHDKAFELHKLQKHG